MCRSLPVAVLVTLPKLVSPKVLSGVLNCGVLARLKLSARNCKLEAFREREVFEEQKIEVAGRAARSWSAGRDCLP